MSTVFDNSENSNQPVTLPPLGKPVLVRRAHCRCIAFRDRDGKWKDYFHRDELADVLEVIPFDVIL